MLSYWCHVCLLVVTADESKPRLVCSTVRRKPLVGVPGGQFTCSPGHHPHLHGPTDHSRHCQPQGTQTQGTRCWAHVKPNSSDKISHTHIYAPAILTCVFFILSAEGGRVPPGFVLGVYSHDLVLVHGIALVRGGHRHLHCPHRLPQDGNQDLGARGTAQISGS